MVIKGAKVFSQGVFHENLEVGFQGEYIDRVRKSIPIFPGEEVLDLRGSGVVIPGFNDAHTHMASFGLSLTRPNLKETGSPDEALQVIEEEVKGHPKGELIIFEGFDQGAWKPSRFLQRRELDRVAPSNPIFVRRICGHVAIVNSLALALLPRETPGVNRERGHLFEHVPLAIDTYFPPDISTLNMAILLAQDKMLELGITSVHEFGDGVRLRCYEELLQAGQLRIRVSFHFYRKALRHLEELGIQSGFGDRFLRILGVKIFLDGSVGARTAAFFESYSNSRRRGRVLLSLHRLREIFERAQEKGVQLLVHAIGDRAINCALKAARMALKGGNPLRHRIEHAEFVRDEEMELAQELGIFFSMQPNFVERWGKENGLYHSYLGEERGLRSNRFNSILTRGIPLAFGSDAMPPGPFFGIKGAREHPREDERISLTQALQAYTRGGALFSGEEDLKGDIEEGKLADILVFAGNPFQVTSLESPSRLPDLVIVGGQILKGSKERVEAKIRRE